MTTDTLLPNYSHLRRPPQHVVAGLREIDPTAELVYLGWGKWMLGSVQLDKIDNWYKKRNGQFSTLRQDAMRILARAVYLLELWRAVPTYRANPGAFRRLIGRYDFAMLAGMGMRPIAEYIVQGEPTSAIVDDFRRRDWLYRHTSDDEFDRSLDEPKDEQRREARKMFSDTERGRAAWSWMFTRSHWYGADPTKERVRSGFKKVASIVKGIFQRAS